MKATVVRNGLHLMGADEASLDALSRLPAGEPLQVEVKRPRNVRMHQKFWALAHELSKASGYSADVIVDVIKIRTGHCKVVKAGRDLIQIPSSISFAKMDQLKFQRFYEEALDVVVRDFLPHLRGESVARIEEMVGIPQSGEVAA